METHPSGNPSDDTATQFAHQCKKTEFTFTFHLPSTRAFPESNADSMATKRPINSSNAPTPAGTPLKKRIKPSFRSSSPPPSLQFDSSDIPDLTTECQSPSNIFDGADWGETETWRNNGAELETTKGEPGMKAVSAFNSETEAPILKQQKMSSFWRKATDEEKNEHNYRTFQRLKETTEFREAEMAWAAHQCKERLKEQNKESQQ